MNNQFKYANVDIAEITHISLCSGYGGIDLGLRRIIENLRTVAYAEIEAFACENLLARMEGGQLDAAPIWSDLRTFPWDQFSGLVDIISGGFPCQPFSAAGKRAGDEDERHIFPAILEGIRRCRPAVVFLENVEGILSAKLAGEDWRDPAGTPVLLHVFRELERVGYKPTAGIFSAAECGAPHQRKRVFVLALADTISERLQRRLRQSVDSRGLQRPAGRGSDNVWPSRPGEPQHAWEPPRVVADPRCRKRDGRQDCERTIGAAQGEFGEASAMGDSKSIRSAALGAKHEGLSGQLCATSASGEGVVGDSMQSRPSSQWASSGEQNRPCQSSRSVGNAPSTGCQGTGGTNNAEWKMHGSTESDGDRSDRKVESEQRQIESPLGGNITRTASGLGYADLCLSCDNRTDELRLLGNGVVPATAALAFETLWNEFSTNTH